MRQGVGDRAEEARLEGGQGWGGKAWGAGLRRHAGVASLPPPAQVVWFESPHWEEHLLISDGPGVSFELTAAFSAGGPNRLPVIVAAQFFSRRAATRYLFRLTSGCELPLPPPCASRHAYNQRIDFVGTEGVCM